MYHLQFRFMLIDTIKSKIYKNSFDYKINHKVQRLETGYEIKINFLEIMRLCHTKLSSHEVPQACWKLE